MNDSTTRRESPPTTHQSIWDNPRSRRWLLSALTLLLAFLIGFVPMWLRAREHGRERDAAHARLRVSQMQNVLANAAIDARRGEYEPARQATSEFYTTLRQELERGRDSAVAANQVEDLRLLLAGRDDTITLLARNDPAAAERLNELYIAYRQATNMGKAAQEN